MFEVFDESIGFTSRASTASDVFDDAAVLDGDTPRVSTTSDGLDTGTKVTTTSEMFEVFDAVGHDASPARGGATTCGGSATARRGRGESVICR
jgi:hypothetical protein